ncbi:low molecular weight protein arginine phosphatase [Priestia megaterium]|uniref:low molecular weight protein arginine phosphatase n=1 Tax=Priestia megaterium TaxID=1404 RepID=UPI0026E325DD|nr:low molecular weight protein arginine phosphatase [Priestia megaterium]MDO6846456.1 low molecular weight protein arginine phosphatase [Priestia megaterium]
MKNILFVCTGNTCRSPMAEALLKAKEIDGINVKSAGVFASNGSEASVHAQVALHQKGIACSHASAALTEEQLMWATYIFTMTEQHKILILNQAPYVSDKLFTLKEFADEQGEVSDPFGGSLQTYEQTLEELERMINKIVDKL